MFVYSSKKNLAQGGAAILQQQIVKRMYRRHRFGEISAYALYVTWLCLVCVRLKYSTAFLTSAIIWLTNKY